MLQTADQKGVNISGNIFPFNNCLTHSLVHALIIRLNLFRRCQDRDRVFEPVLAVRAAGAPQPDGALRGAGRGHHAGARLHHLHEERGDQRGTEGALRVQDHTRLRSHAQGRVAAQRTANHSR